MLAAMAGLCGYAYPVAEVGSEAPLNDALDGVGNIFNRRSITAFAEKHNGAKRDSCGMISCASELDSFMTGEANVSMQAPMPIVIAGHGFYPIAIGGLVSYTSMPPHHAQPTSSPTGSSSPSCTCSGAQ